MPDQRTESLRGKFDRRKFLQSAPIALCAAQTLPTPLLALASSNLKAVAFDGFAIFDPRPLFNLVMELFPVRGVELSREWRTRQFEYTWLRTVSGKYNDFWHVTDDALTYAASKTNVSVSQESRGRLMNAYLKLEPWPDVVSALTVLRKTGTKMALLSNFTQTMLCSCIENAGLHNTFDHLLSTDMVKLFKPAPNAYQMGVDAFRLSKQEIAFVAFAGWDAAGAKTFGFPTYWVNRLKEPPEELGVTADRTEPDLAELAQFLSLK